jgi:hypothetical protein
LQGGKERYFAYAYKKFMEAVQKGANIKLEEFAGISECSEIVYQISNHFCEKFDYYVSSDDEEMMPFDKFIREAEIGKRYYISGVLIYHW